jgi:hypothetical protein
MYMFPKKSAYSDSYTQLKKENIHTTPSHAQLHVLWKPQELRPTAADLSSVRA